MDLNQDQISLLLKSINPDVLNNILASSTPKATSKSNKSSITIRKLKPSTSTSSDFSTVNQDSSNPSKSDENKKSISQKLTDTYKPNTPLIQTSRPKRQRITESEPTHALVFWLEEELHGIVKIKAIHLNGDISYQENKIYMTDYKTKEYEARLLSVGTKDECDEQLKLKALERAGNQEKKKVCSQKT